MTTADNIRTLTEAATILHQHEKHAAAEVCTSVAATIAVDQVLGDEPAPAPGNRLQRLTEGCAS